MVSRTSTIEFLEVMKMKTYEEKKEDLQKLCEAFKQLDANGRAIAMGAITCMLAKQQMDENKKEAS